MLLHIGGNTVVRTKNVVALLEKEIAGANRPFFKNRDLDRPLVHISDEETKTYVVTPEKIYCSPISSFTLKRRSTNPHE